jgi:hypothetical protein
MEKPIIFSGEMVRAVLDGRKTQTRRVVGRDLPAEFHLDEEYRNSEHIRFSKYPGYIDGNKVFWARNPYKKGMKLWVRETWRFGGSGIDSDECAGGPWKPSIHMHHSGSRITLLVKDVRVERVQDISRDSAIKEGVRWENCPLEQTIADVEYSKTRMCSRQTVDYRSGFRKLWNSIYAKKGHGWDVNPWVWVVEFERCE